MTTWTRPSKLAPKPFPLLQPIFSINFCPNLSSSLDHMFPVSTTLFHIPRIIQIIGHLVDLKSISAVFSARPGILTPSLLSSVTNIHTVLYVGHKRAIKTLSYSALTTSCCVSCEFKKTSERVYHYLEPHCSIILSVCLYPHAALDC